MISRYINTFRFFFVCIDLFVLNFVHFILVNNFSRIPEKGEQSYMTLFFAANMVWLISAYSTSLYVDDGYPSLRGFAKRSLKSVLVYYFAMAMFVFIYHYPFSRLFIFSAFLLFGIFLVAIRILLVLASSLLSKPGKTNKRVVILGYNEVAKNLAHSFAFNNRNLSVEGYFDDLSSIRELSLLPIIGNIDECITYAVNNNVSEIYSTISPERNKLIYEMAKTAEKSLIRFKFVPDFKFYVNRNTHIEYLDRVPILSLRPEPLEDITNSIKKRLFDIVFSLLVVVFLLSWMVPLLAILIKLNSRGPVFFVQWRSGKNNKKFQCYKFRTLSVNADAHLRQVTKDDSRLTPLGRFLRKTNLDEFPQFFNVLKGDMSVVGPRPHMLLHTETFSKIMEEYMVRHFVKPGVTGWAQVNGFRGEIKEEEQLRQRIEHDIGYMENWSLWLDMKIMWLTIFKTFKGDSNAY